MVMFDTNMILRYLLNDNKEMADKAEEYLGTENVSVTIEAIAEVIYVLKGVYSIQRKDIADTVKGFLNLVYCRDMDVLITAIDAYGEKILNLLTVYFMVITKTEANETDPSYLILLMALYTSILPENWSFFHSLF